MGIIAAWLGFGKRGILDLYHTEMEHQDYIDRIRRLTKENQALLEEIHRLRTDMKYVESVARKELNLIKQNEIIYRFSSEKTPNNDIRLLPSGAKHVNKTRKSEKEVGHNGEIK